MTSEITYLGELRTKATHIASGNDILTDAPLDNQGRGEEFSPTDLFATSLGNCMITIMGILAKNININIDGTRAEITKLMAANPRRVSQIICKIYFPNNNFSSEQKRQMENAALNCPVAKSLHPDIIQDVTFIYL